MISGDDSTKDLISNNILNSYPGKKKKKKIKFLLVGEEDDINS